MLEVLSLFLSLPLTFSFFWKKPESRLTYNINKSVLNLTLILSLSISSPALPALSIAPSVLLALHNDSGSALKKKKILTFSRSCRIFAFAFLNAAHRTFILFMQNKSAFFFYPPCSQVPNGCLVNMRWGLNVFNPVPDTLHHITEVTLSVFV